MKPRRIIQKAAVFAHRAKRLVWQKQRKAEKPPRRTESRPEPKMSSQAKERFRAVAWLLSIKIPNEKIEPGSSQQKYARALVLVHNELLREPRFYEGSDVVVVTGVIEKDLFLENTAVQMNKLRAELVKLAEVPENINRLSEKERIKAIRDRLRAYYKKQREFDWLKVAARGVLWEHFTAPSQEGEKPLQ